MNRMTSPNINYLWADLLIEELIRNGVNIFCISSGSRSSPLTMAVAANTKAKSFIHFDERGSAFRALGIVSATKKPCAVITTSGTAAANVFPAVVEASKKKIPLIILTADRPPELRWTGAHQTIDQTKIYGEYVRWYFDMPCPTTEIPPEFVLTTVDQAVFRSKGNPGGPVHINCMYREPLAPVKTPTNLTPYTQSIKEWGRTTSTYTHYILPKPKPESSDIQTVSQNIKQMKSGIIVVGKLATVKERNSVLKLAEQLNWPVFADISSGLRLGNTHQNIVHYFDQILLSNNFQKKFTFDGVLHIGGRITSKRWYEFIEATKPKHYIMVINHPLRNDPFHKVTMRIQCPIDPFISALVKQLPKRTQNTALSTLQKANTTIDQMIDRFFNDQNTLSEPQTARLITELVKPNNSLFISNSMPIRDVDVVGAIDGKPVVCGANRGASGIDGIIASAVGFATGIQKPTTLLIGDLAFCYDLNSLAMLKDLEHPLTIVVLNNNGGGIFSFLPIQKANGYFERYFGTPHHLSFNSAADLFDLNYTQAQTAEEFTKAYRIAQESRTSTIIEIQTHRDENVKIHENLQNIIKNTIFKESKKSNGVKPWQRRLQTLAKK